jgi:hypothetical protein
MQPIEDFVAACAIKMQCEEVDLAADDRFRAADPWAPGHYRCRLRSNHRVGRITITLGSDDGPPELSDVLEVLAADAAVVDEAQSFEDWAIQLGFDPDSRYAERLYRAAQRQACRLRELLGDEYYSRLLWETKRL